MPNPRQADPVKACANCGNQMSRRRYGKTLEDAGAFSRRKYCSRPCMAAGMEGTIKVANPENSRRQSAKTVKRACERCGRRQTRLYVHHRDRDPMNNGPTNLVTLCGSCHRLSHSPNFSETTGQKKTCSYCSAPVARKGLCCSHLTRLKRNGNPLTTRVKIGSEWRYVYGRASLSPHSPRRRSLGSGGCAPTATRSVRRKPSRSSRPSSEPSMDKAA